MLSLSRLNKRMGLGARPRKLDIEDLSQIRASPLKSADSAAAADSTADAVRAAGAANKADAAAGADHEVKRSRRDAAGNRVSRVRREADTDMADIETEKVIQVS